MVGILSPEYTRMKKALFTGLFVVAKTAYVSLGRFQTAYRPSRGARGGGASRREIE